MKKKGWILLVIAIVAAGFGAGFYLGRSSEPKSEIVQMENVMEVYEEFSTSNMRRIHLDLQNENVRVSPSENAYIRIVYRPSTDGLTFQYSRYHDILSIRVGEVESEDRLIPSAREMIYIYLPDGYDGTLEIHTDSGFVNVEGISLGRLEISTNSGSFSVSRCDIADASLSTQQGTMYVRDSAFEKMAIESQTGKLYLRLVRPIGEYAASISGGSLVYNDLEVAQIAGAQEGEDLPSLSIQSRGLVSVRDAASEEEEPAANEESGGQEQAQ